MVFGLLKKAHKTFGKDKFLFKIYKTFMYFNHPHNQQKL